MNEKTIGPKDGSLRMFILFGLFTSLLGALFQYVMKRSWPNVIGAAIFTFAICMLSYLGYRFKTVDRVTRRVFAIWISFFGSLFLSLLPINFFYWVSPIILGRLATGWQVVVFVIWGVLLILGLLSVAFERYREKVLRRLLKLGRIAPVAYSFNLLVIAILFFSSLTYVFANHGALRLNAPPGTQISPEVVRDFYSWHFLQAVPLLKVNDTLHWKAPLTYDSTSVGLMLVVFQLLVIVPVIAAFAWFWKNLASGRKKKLNGVPWRYPFSS